MRWCQTLGQKAGLIADLLIPHWEVGAFARCPPSQLESAMQKATTFEHGGKVYEVRAIPTLNGWKVRIFVDGIPANGFTYSVDSEIGIDGGQSSKDDSFSRKIQIRSVLEILVFANG